MFLIEENRVEMLARIEKYNALSAQATENGDHDTSLLYQEKIQRIRKRMRHVNPQDRKWEKTS